MNDNRTYRSKIAESTLSIMKNGYFVSSNGEKISISKEQLFAENNTKVYTPIESDELILNYPTTKKFNTVIQVSNETSLNAVRNLLSKGHKNIVCLNFASAKNPGGGFLGGSQAQEESIARATGLYNCLLTANEYYETNKSTKSCFYTDYMIYSPNVPIFKTENGDNLSELFTCSFITAPAVNKGVIKQREPERINEIETVMKRRIKKVLSIAQSNKHSVIVLGAWGCGVFQNNPQDIARYFYEILHNEYQGVFEHVVFAIYAKRKRFIEPFQELFEVTNKQ